MAIRLTQTTLFDLQSTSSMLKTTIMSSSSTYLFHVLCSLPSFLWPLTSNCNALPKTLLCSILNSCPYQGKLFTVVNWSISPFNMLIPTKSYSPLYSNPLYSNPLYSNPIYSNPLYSNQLYSNPLYSNPLYSNPLYSNPLYSNPLYSNPLYSNQLYSNPLYSNPLYSKYLLLSLNCTSCTGLTVDLSILPKIPMSFSPMSHRNANLK